jgi:SAM-dependent methyltransferase
MYKRLKNYLRRKIWAIILLNIVKNYWNGVRYALGFRTIRVEPGADPLQDAKYALHMVAEYEKAAGDAWDMEDKVVIELGPGPYKSVALILLARGAKKVICYDKYRYESDSDYEKMLYRSLYGLLQDAEQERLMRIVEPESGALRKGWEQWIEIRQDHTVMLAFEDTCHVADWIVSRSVLEYLDELNKVMATCSDCLKPGGRMVHKVDLRDDGMFSEAGCDPKTYLKIQPLVYKTMVGYSYRPRQRLVDDYLTAAGNVCADAVFCVVRYFGDAREHMFVNKIESNHMQNASVATREINVAGGFLITRKR